MGYGPKMTRKQEERLKAEIAAFDKAKTLARIEKESVSKKDVNAYHDYLEQQVSSGECVSANPDGLEESKEQDKANYKPSLQELSAKIEINDILSFRQRQVWTMMMRQNMSLHETAAKLRLTERTVATYLHTATQKVRTHFHVE